MSLATEQALAQLGVPKAASLRNFCIIAHIDHGKSTLADRLLEATGSVAPSKMVKQVLDAMDLERERGITIKSHPVRMVYSAPDGAEYVLNLIDTPGHVDFTYEVSRSLAACEGALLLVDASQGVEAQTVSNVLLALEHELALIPVVNKVDLSHAQPDAAAEEIGGLVGIDPREVIRASAKEGLGTREVLEAIVERVPPPGGDPSAPLRALIFDAFFDAYRGTVAYVRVVDGTLRRGMQALYMSTGQVREVQEVGLLTFGQKTPTAALVAGDVGYVIAGVKEVTEARVGDTLTDGGTPASAALPGYREVKPMVFAGLYPVDPDEYDELKAALERLRLNDWAFTYGPETSQALGFGFRCGFLGLLHREIVQERLAREFGMEIITTAPSVAYRAVLRGGEVVVVDNPAKFPNPALIERIEEPWLTLELITPSEYLGNVMRLVHNRRGQVTGTHAIGAKRVSFVCEVPLAEIVYDFYDKLKSATRGYASFDYEYLAHRTAAVQKLDILLNGEPVDALSVILHRDRARERALVLCQKLRQEIPRQLFPVIIQGALGSKVIARETISPLRKNVTAKCYGGDITRKRKLLERQKEGRKRLKLVGTVEIPQEAFLAVLGT